MSTAVITGWGAISPLGNAQETAQALGTGETAIAELDDRTLSSLDRAAEPSELTARSAARIDFNPRQAFAGKNFRPVDRTGQLVILAAEAALEQSGWGEGHRGDEEIGLVLGTMFGSVHTISAFDRRGLEAGPKYVKPLDFANSVINAAAGQAAIWLGLRGSNSTVTGANTASVLALGQAGQLIRDGRSRVLLAGGAEELSFEALFGFQQAGLLTEDRPRPFGAHRDGTALGEGAALLVVEDGETARARGAEAWALLCGHGNAFDVSRGRDPEKASGALERALRAALDEAGCSTADVDVVVSGASGLPGDAAEGMAISRVFGAGTPVTSVAPALGQCLGAHGAFSSLALVHALRGGGLAGLGDLQEPDPALPPLDLCTAWRELDVRRGVVTALGLDGGAAAIVLEKVVPEKRSSTALRPS